MQSEVIHMPVFALHAVSVSFTVIHVINQLVNYISLCVSRSSSTE